MTLPQQIDPFRPDASCPAVVPMTPPSTTRAMRDALSRAAIAAQADLLFLEAWERSPTLGGIQRVRQLRRANPVLAAALRAELARPATMQAGDDVHA